MFSQALLSQEAWRGRERAGMHAQAHKYQIPLPLRIAARCAVGTERHKAARVTDASFPCSRSAGNAGCKAEINHMELAVSSLTFLLNPPTLPHDWLESL